MSKINGNAALIAQRPAIRTQEITGFTLDAETISTDDGLQFFFNLGQTRAHMRWNTNQTFWLRV
jgi:hypothetical protein